MNLRTCTMLLVFVAALMAFMGLPKVGSSFNQKSGLRLDVVTDKEEYLVGEPVHLKFNIVNQSDSQKSLYPGSTVWDGYIDVFVAYQGEDFKRYRGPQWGLRDVYYKEPLNLNPGETFESEATMLCNPRLETGHLNETASKRAQQRENLVQGNYVLSRPGFYFVRAVLRDPKSNEIIESIPVRILAEAPQGADLAVWNKIKDRRDYAYFIHTGSLANPTDEQTSKVAQKLQEIVTSHPNSKYADGIQKSLKEHQAVVDKASKSHPSTKEN